MILIEDADPDHGDARGLIAALSQRLAAITGSSGQASFDADDVRGPGAAFLLARDEEGRAIGCGALRPLQPGVAEIKRMYAAVAGQGVGSAVLAALEAKAKSLGYDESGWKRVASTLWPCASISAPAIAKFRPMAAMSADRRLSVSPSQSDRLPPKLTGRPRRAVMVCGTPVSGAVP